MISHSYYNSILIYLLLYRSLFSYLDTEFGDNNYFVEDIRTESRTTPKDLTNPEGDYNFRKTSKQGGESSSRDNLELVGSTSNFKGISCTDIEL